MILLAIEPKSKDLGDDFVVRRSLPDINKRSVGPFIFWDHMGPVEINSKREMKVRAHPHIGLATITYLFSGEIVHRDSLNNIQTIKPGEVNWMTAGRGIVHSERVQKRPIPMILEGIQLWVALPKEEEDVKPSFHHFKEASLPLIKMESLELRLIAGQALNHKSEVPVYSDLFYFDVKSKAQSQFKFNLESQQEAAAYVIKGELKINGVIYKRYSMIIFKLGASLEFDVSADAEFMFFGGTPFPEKRFMWWNFVSSSQDKIEVAKKSWSSQTFGQVIDEQEYIPLPEN
jgi:redox-sensitive bicupin YhaK (pirin superfamily)